MKIKWILFGVVSLWLRYSFAAETHPYYRNITDRIWGTNECIRLPECQPADKDPSGHWSTNRIEGQLGIRFATNNYALGQPVVARIFLRNTSTKVIKYGQSRGIPMGVAQFHVMTTNHQEVALLVNEKDYIKNARPVISVIGPGFQNEFSERLDTVFDLSKLGTYLIYAEAWFNAREGVEEQDWKTVRSGVATITITPPKYIDAHN